MADKVNINIDATREVVQVLVSSALTKTLADTLYQPIGGSGSGDVTKVVYDPNLIESDMFDMSNMVESATEKILTATERANIITNNAKVTNVDHPLVETAVPLGAVFTDTDTVYDDTAIQAEVDLNTAKLTANTANVDSAGAVMESDFTPAFSILAQQSGTGSPSAVTVGTNMLVGRVTGGGSEIDDLSPSTVRTLLNVEDGATADQDLSSYATLTGTETLTNKTLTNPSVNNYTEGVVVIGNSGATQTLALTSGTFQTVTLTADCNFTMPTATAGKSFTLKILTGAGAFMPTFTGVKYPYAITPTWDETSSRYYFVYFQADGTAWSASQSDTYTV